MYRWSRLNNRQTGHNFNILYETFILKKPSAGVCVAKATLAFYLEDLEGEDDHRLLSSVYDVVAVGVEGVLSRIIRRNHAATGGCEVSTAP